MSNDKIRVTTDETLFKRHKWRGQITICPYCDNEPKDSYRVWETPKYLRYVFANDQHLHNWKADSIRTFSECQKCFKISWVHMDIANRFTSYDQKELKWPKEVIKAVLAERKKRIQKAMVDFLGSDCPPCKNLYSLDLQYLYPIVKCIIKGQSNSEHPENGDKCKHCRPRNVKAKKKRK